MLCMVTIVFIRSNVFLSFVSMSTCDSSRTHVYPGEPSTCRPTRARVPTPCPSQPFAPGRPLLDLPQRRIGVPAFLHKRLVQDLSRSRMAGKMPYPKRTRSLWSCLWVDLDNCASIWRPVALHLLALPSHQNATAHPVDLTAAMLSSTRMKFGDDHFEGHWRRVCGGLRYRNATHTTKTNKSHNSVRAQTHTLSDGNSNLASVY